MTEANIYATIANDVLADAKSNAQELHDMVATVKTARGSKADIQKWIDHSTDESVVARRDAVAKAKAKVAEIEAELVAEATSALVPEDIDIDAIHAEFKEKRTETLKTLNAAKLILGKAGVEDLSEIDEAIDNLPKNLQGLLASSGRSPKELEAIREFAKQNGLEVSERGRIAKSVIEAYEEANKG